MVGNLDIKVRPLKLAYLVDPNDKDQVSDAIRLSSTLWGGVYFPIFTLHRRMPKTWRESHAKTPEAKKVMLGYLEAFDPDVLVQFSKTVPEFIVKTGLKIIRPTDVWADLTEGGNLSPKFGIGIFELLKDIFEEYFRYKVKYPVKVIIPRIPTELSVFWASLFGEIPPELSDAVRQYTEPLEIESVDFTPDKLTEMLAGNVLFPRRVVRRGLTTFNHSSLGRHAALYFLDATKVEDVVDFWNLRAMGKEVLPIPKQLEDDLALKNLIIGFLKRHRRPWPHNPKVSDNAAIIKSRNRTMDELQEYAKTLTITKEPDDPSESAFLSLQHWYPRVWDEWARDKHGAVVADVYGKAERSVEIDSKKLQITFKPLLPEFANKFGYHDEPRCANEIAFRLYGSDDYLAEVLPKSSGENYRQVISSWGSFRGEWRVGTHGLVRLVTDDFGETRDIPTAESIMFSWLTDLGWKPELSAPGLLAKQIYRQLDGLLSILKNEKMLGLLEHMNGGRVKQDGSPADQNIISQERELPIGEVKSRLEGSTKRGDLHDYLLSKGVFKLGLRVQCPHCMRHSWFALESVRDTLSCPRCLNVFEAVKTVRNATWSYKTTGPFSVPQYAEGAYAVLLTLSFFSDHNLPTMRTTPVLSFKATGFDGKTLETDAALFWQDAIFGERRDGILFAECKSYDHFKAKDFKRIRQLAKAFPGAVLVFSTLRKSLSPKEITEIKRIAKAGRRYWKSERPINPVLILTGTELIDQSSPPYCWEELLQKKFGHVHGLINLCDTTQQIYLNLPSWQRDWHEKWEKRRQRLQSQQSSATQIVS